MTSHVSSWSALKGAFPRITKEEPSLKALSGKGRQ